MIPVLHLQIYTYLNFLYPQDDLGFEKSYTTACWHCCDEKEISYCLETRHLPYIIGSFHQDFSFLGCDFSLWDPHFAWLIFYWRCLLSLLSSLFSHHESILAQLFHYSLSHQQRLHELKSWLIWPNWYHNPYSPCSTPSLSLFFYQMNEPIHLSFCLTSSWPPYLHQQ